MSSLLRRGMEYPVQKPRQADDGAAAVIAIRPLCIKHTFVESKERREERKGTGENGEE